MSITIKDEKIKIQNEQILLDKFNSFIKTMDSIVFLAYGDETITKDGLDIFAGNLSLLHYTLWKCFEEAYGQKYSFKDFNAERMFLSAMSGSWQVPEKVEYSYINNPFGIIAKASYSSSSDLFQDLYTSLDISRKHGMEPVKVISLGKNLAEKSDLAISCEILEKSFKAKNANNELLVILIITSFLCASTTKKKKNFNYKQNMTLLFRLALFLGGNTFIEQLNCNFAECLEPMKQSIKSYAALSCDRTVKDEVCFLFSTDNDSVASLLSIERELFRITQKLFRLSNPEYVKEKEKVDVSKILERLIQLTAQNPAYKFGCDEENFYYLLNLANKETRRESGNARDDS